MDDEADISSGTDTDEDGALIEKARQAAEQKRAPPRKRGPTSESLAYQPADLHRVCYNFSAHSALVLMPCIHSLIFNGCTTVSHGRLQK